MPMGARTAFGIFLLTRLVGEAKIRTVSLSATSDDQISVGVVGLGQLAREVHLPLLRRMPQVRVEALADPSAEALRQCLPLATGARSYSSCEALLAEARVDAVLIASPTGEHARQAESVLAAGKALYLEKPIAATLKDGCDVASAASRRKAAAMMGFNYRFHPLIQSAKRKIERIGPGRLQDVRSDFSIAPRPLPTWKQKRSTGGGVLLDLGSHHFYLLSYLLDARVETVSARIWSERTEGDCATLELTFENGVRAKCSYSFCRVEKDELEFKSENGRILIDRYAPLRFPLWPVSDFAAYQRERLRSPWKEVSFGRSLAAWVTAVQRREQPPLTTEDGLEALRVVLGAEQSALEAQPIQLEKLNIPEPSQT